MELIAHRKNTLAELLETDTRYGIEVDIRSHGHELVMHHDPFEPGEPFLPWLDAYAHGTLILNVKEEGLEQRLIDEMSARGIERYFFLDQSFPFLVRWTGRGLTRTAVRVSEFESVDQAMMFAGRAEWAWVDCFSRFPLSAHDAERLASSGFARCLVSPELQGRDPEASIPAMAAELRSLGITPEAVCTKRPDLWERCFQT